MLKSSECQQCDFGEIKVSYRLKIVGKLALRDVRSNLSAEKNRPC